MLDSVFSLVFSMYSNPGVYALLLGSGISRTAAIPTGWEVVTDLVRKVAALKNEDCEPDPVAWYGRTFGESPDYSKLLGMLAKTPAERNQVLKDYFEPTDEEREQGIKTPTAAHKAIARMVADGYVRVIVTTNFDRLLERALEDVGVIPTIISSPDATEGAMPLSHVRCCVIKVHGDYLDTRTKNTVEELAQYDPRIDQMLDRIFDEFGLVVCGWSAEWDTALRASLERCRNHRFTTYWASMGEPSEAAKRLVELRRAEVIQIKDADSFFVDLVEKVRSLKDIGNPHPLSAKMATATLKRYLQDGRNRIKVFDLIRDETERVYGEISEDQFPAQNVKPSAEELRRRVRRYEALAEVLTALFITGCYWGDREYEPYWAKCLERIANPSGNPGGYRCWLDLRRYPALLLAYAGGMAAITAGKYETLAALTVQTRVRDNGQQRPTIAKVNGPSVIAKDFAQLLEGMERHHTPVSDHVFQVLREPLRYVLPADEDYQQCFDRFEYLYGLIYVDVAGDRGDRIWGPVGRFKWRGDDGEGIWHTIDEEIVASGGGWLPLQAGLFGGSLERLRDTKAAYDEFLGTIHFW